MVENGSRRLLKVVDTEATNNRFQRRESLNQQYSWVSWVSPKFHRIDYLLTKYLNKSMAINSCYNSCGLFRHHLAMMAFLQKLCPENLIAVSKAWALPRDRTSFDT